MYSKKVVISQPDQAPEISKIAEQSLRRAGAIGVLPTPVNDLIAAAKIQDKSDDNGSFQEFSETLPETARRIFKTIENKVRGITDYRQPIIYTRSDTKPRQLFVKSHELGHHDIPWHNIFSGSDGFLHDNNHTLSSEVKELFEQEANFYASEIIYQGKYFVDKVQSYQPSFDVIFYLASLHGASRQATLRKYVESQDEILAAIEYLPSNRTTCPESGLPVLQAPRLFGSRKFLRKYENIELPSQLSLNHPWGEARSDLSLPHGEINLGCDGISTNFWWQAWWNNYALLVLLRRKPRLSIIGHALRRNS